MRRKRGRHRRHKDRTLPLGTAVILASAAAGIYLTASPDGASAAAVTVYVAPGGSDHAAGTLSAPFRTLGKAFSVAGPGTTIEVHGGTYYPRQTLASSVDGTARERVTLRPYHAEPVTVDGSRLPPGSPLVSLAADYWTIAGLDFRDAPDRGVVCTSCADGVFTDLATHANGASGFTLRGRHTDGNLVQNLDSYDNHDDATQGRGADGLAITAGSGKGNKVTGARLFDNSNDGLDLDAWGSPVTIEHTWAYGNGTNRWRIPDFEGEGNGFALGGGSPAPAAAHRVFDSAAWDNAWDGFTDHGNAGGLRLSRTTAYANGGYGYDFPASPTHLVGDLAADNAIGPQEVGAAAECREDSWSPGVRTPRFITTDPAKADAPRQPGGALPDTGYLAVADGSGLGATMGVREVDGSISVP
jgi:hypothetical protein